MKKKILLLITLQTFFIISCSEHLVSPIYSELSNEIIGSWKNQNIQISFDKNYNFTESLKIIDFGFSGEDLIITRSGKYEIIDSVLILKANSWIFSNPELIKGGISIVPYYDEINFIDGKLIRRPVYVFSTSGSNKKELKGEWKMVQWCYHKTDTVYNIEYAGIEETFYDFLNSDTVLYGWKYLDGNPFENPSWETNYQYNPPKLTIPGPSFYNMIVEFKKSKMYWYLDQPLQEYSRIN
jgi:hypothetical protein